MTLAKLITLIINLSLALLVFGIGLAAVPGSIRSLATRPGLLARSLLAMNVIMPVLAVLLALVGGLEPALLAAFITLAVSPVPPFLPGRMLKAGGTPTFAVGLTAITALLAIGIVPLSVALLRPILGPGAHLAPPLVSNVVLTSVLLPLLAGMLLHRLRPRLASRLARPVLRTATIVLAVASLPLLVKVGPAMWHLVGDFTLVAIVAFVLVGLAVGHALGGPAAADRTVLALSTSTRHPGVALAITHAAFPDRPRITAAILLYVIVGAIAATPYARSRKHAHAAARRDRPTSSDG